MKSRREKMSAPQANSTYRRPNILRKEYFPKKKPASTCPPPLKIQQTVPSSLHTNNVQKNDVAIVHVKIEPGLDRMNHEHGAIRVKVEDGLTMHVRSLVEHSYARQAFSSDVKPVIQVFTSPSEVHPQVAIQPKIENCHTSEPPTSLVNHSNGGADSNENRDGSLAIIVKTEPDLSVVKEETADGFVESTTSVPSIFPTNDDDAVLLDHDTDKQPFLRSQVTAEDNNVNLRLSRDIKSDDFDLPKCIVAKSEPGIDIKEEFPVTFNTHSVAMTSSEIIRRDDSYYLNLHEIRSCKVLLQRVNPITNQLPWKDRSNERTRELRSSKRDRHMHRYRDYGKTTTHSRTRNLTQESGTTDEQNTSPRIAARNVHQCDPSIEDGVQHNTKNNQANDVDVFECDTCKLSFALKKSLRSHVLTHLKSRKKGDQKCFSCDICKKVIKSKYHFKQHLKAHSTTFTCPVCKKELRSKPSLDYHNLIHSGIKPFECTVCKNRFFIKSHLETHLRVHDEKFRKCTHCAVMFSSPRELYNHLQTHPSHREKCHENENRYKCDKCPKSYLHKGDLKRHQLSHSDLKPFPCPFCPRGFIKRSDLNRHVETTHMGLRKYECDLCKKRFPRKCHLLSHMETHFKTEHQGPPLHQCEVCMKRFQQKCQLTRHLSTHAMPKHQCEVCGKQFSHRHQLARHKGTHFGPTSVCEICKKPFSHKNELTRHMSTHSMPMHECEVCKKRYKRKYLLTAHMGTHSIPTHSMYQCEVCKKQFLEKSHLIRHIGIHSMPMYQCQVCKKRYSRKDLLTAHMDIHSKPMYQCDVCKKRFSHRRQFAYHKNTHSLPMFECKICQKRFLHKFRLTRHMSTHSMPTHKCEVCKRLFARKDNLAHHKATHSLAKLFRCGVCCKRYKSKFTLRSHLKIHFEPRKQLRTQRKKDFQCGKCLKWFQEKRNLRVHMMIHLRIRPFKCDACGARFVTKSTLKSHIVKH